MFAVFILLLKQLISDCIFGEMDSYWMCRCNDDFSGWQSSLALHRTNFHYGFSLRIFDLISSAIAFDSNCCLIQFPSDETRNRSLTMQWQCICHGQASPVGRNGCRKDDNDLGMGRTNGRRTVDVRKQKNMAIAVSELNVGEN